MLSGLTVEEVRQGGARLAAVREALARSGAPAGDVDAAHQSVMLASQGQRPFSGPGWLFEIKYDGVRILAARDGDAVTLYGRAGQDFTSRYPEVVTALRALPATRFVLDGEVDRARRERPPVVPAPAEPHAPDARRPTSSARAATVPVSAVFFDALALEGRDLRRLPLAERKALLALTVPARGVIHYGGHVVEQGEAFYEAAAEQRLEGIVAKRAEGRYTGGRTREWLKIKCHLRQEFVIGGWTDPQGARGWFGALHLGVYEGDRLVYVGKVGTGFDEAMLRQVWDRLQPLARPKSPFASRHADGPRPSLGRADPGRRGPLHGVDGGGRHSPPRLPGAARRQARQRRAGARPQQPPRALRTLRRTRHYALAATRRRPHEDWCARQRPSSARWPRHHRRTPTRPSIGEWSSRIRRRCSGRTRGTRSRISSATTRAWRRGCCRICARGRSC